ncbi:MAG: hypothetical protein IPL09_05835 [Bacteroidetes bacterium]|nr:hypothetical protein [Bacteroidota bacterium]
MSMLPIGYVPISAKDQYNFTDPHLSERNNYYRLKIMDEDGQFTYSKTVMVLNTEKTEIICYPNPVKETLNISSSANSFTYFIYDICMARKYSKGNRQTSKQGFHVRR